jgi:uncharacterized protein YodC (DUF2158 family)
MVYKPGDVVRLKSGGPMMTVLYVNTVRTDPLDVHCAWFINDEHKAGNFTSGCLEPAKAEHGIQCF